MKYLITNKPVTNLEFPYVEGRFSETVKDRITIYQDSANITEYDDAIALTEGYIFNQTTKKDGEILALREVASSWPLSQDVTGSFSITIIKDSTIRFCNDCIGVYPLYYYIKEDIFIISSDIYWMSHALDNAQFDEVGIVQKLIDNESANIGSRTILKDVKRLLPGELIHIENTSSIQVQRYYDNTLFKIDDRYNCTKKSLNDYWDRFSGEVETLLSKEKESFLATSGGMDSRILLGAVPEKTNLTCLTYGHADHYEVKIACRLAKKKKAAFKSFGNYAVFFPAHSTFENYIKESEIFNIAPWLQILENVPKKKEATLMIGDVCEVLPGRNIKAYSSRKSRLKLFFKHNILNQYPAFTKVTPNDLRVWIDSKLPSLLKPYEKSRIEALDLHVSFEEIIAGITQDYQDLFDRIEAHHIPYYELFNEIFQWYTFGRNHIGHQVVTCNSKFNATCPSISLNILRMTSAIHPKYRVNYRFMNALFRRVKSLKQLNSIPTNQSPFVNRNLPNIFIFLAWGIRSKIDQFLIQRLMKNKNPNMRYRFLKSLNWVEVYQQPGVLETYKSYFSFTGDPFPSEKSNAIEVLKGRIRLNRWPLATTDLMGLASTVTKINLIKSIFKAKEPN